MQPLLVFDLDGTLAETAGDLVGALNAVIAPEGLDAVSIGAVRSMVGAGARALIERAHAAQGRALSADELERLFRAFLAHYEANIANESTLFPGVLEALDRLEVQGYAFAICTNKFEGASRKLVAALGIAHRFRAICGQDTFGVAKPDPRVLLGTIEKAGGTRARAVMIGDSGTDIALAKAVGVPCVAVDFGYTDRPVEEYGPNIVISHFDALEQAVAHVLGAGAARSPRMA